MAQHLNTVLFVAIYYVNMTKQLTSAFDNPVYPLKPHWLSTYKFSKLFSIHFVEG